MLFWLWVSVVLGTCSKHAGARRPCNFMASFQLPGSAKALRCLGIVLTIVVAYADVYADEHQTITRHYTRADRERDRYVYVPFDVPAGTTEVRVRYQYDRANGQNTVDLGIFEPGSLDIGTTTLRGYSGGSKSEVRIGEHDATPGYKAGPLPAGRWHVMLGLYTVAEAGVRVTITVETSAKGDAAEGRWWSGALHTHTLHSDGTVSATELLDRIRNAGLDFVTITDHNNTTHRDEVLRDGPPPTPLWIVGEEVTTPAGHANVWGLDAGEWVDFRVRPAERGVGELVKAAHQYGALFSINHPAGECGGCSWEHDVPDPVDAIEVWNGRHGAQDKAVALWERLLREGRRVTAVGASDWHRDPDPIDHANVRVFASELGERAILEALRAGRVIVMRSAADRTPTFTVRAGPKSATVGESVTAIAKPAVIEVLAPGVQAGRAVVIVNGTRLPAISVGDGPARLERVLEPGYVRCEIYAADGALVSLMNPVFVTR